MVNSDKEWGEFEAKKVKWSHPMERFLVNSDKKEDDKPDFDSNTLADDFSKETLGKRKILNPSQMLLLQSAILF